MYFGEVATVPRSRRDFHGDAIVREVSRNGCDLFDMFDILRNFARDLHEFFPPGGLGARVLLTEILPCRSSHLKPVYTFKSRHHPKIGIANGSESSTTKISTATTMHVKSRGAVWFDRRSSARSIFTLSIARFTHFRTR